MTPLSGLLQKTKPLLVLTLALAAVAPATALAAVIRVDASAVGLNNGSSWANAYQSLQSALGVAMAGDQIWIANGSYKPGAAGNSQAAFVIADGVALYGGFAGTEASLAQRNVALNVSVLSGDIDNNDTVDANGVTTVMMGSNSYHVVRTGAVSAQTRIDGVTIAGGNAGQNDANGWFAPIPDGGGVLIEGGAPVLENLRIVQNGARHGGGVYATGAFTMNKVVLEANGVWQDGGALYVTAANPTLTQVELRNNLAWSGNGGGMSCVQAAPTILDSKFVDNKASDKSGGGLYGDHCPAVVQRVQFVQNSAGGHALFNHGGGGYSNREGSPLLSEVRFEGNRANLGDGGGFQHLQGDLQFDKLTFVGNVAGAMGGGMALGGTWGQVVVVDSEFRANVGKGDPCANCFVGDGGGGGLANEGGITTTLVNLLFSGNAATNGGAIYNGAQPLRPLTVVNGSFSGNYAYAFAGYEETGRGGGIYNGGDSQADIQNSVFWNNQDGSGVGTHRASIYNSNAVAEINNGMNQLPSFQEVLIRYSLVQGCKPGGVWEDLCGIDSGGNLNDANPAFAANTPVGNMLGSTAGDAHLKLGSPALNKGNNLLIPAGITKELDGNPRISNGSVDLGAYELAMCPPNRTMHVTTTGAGSKDGSSWANATDSLQYALSMTVSTQCNVWVAKGTYRPSASGDRTKSFRLKNLIAVYGGFAGTETTLAQRLWTANPTYLSGDIGTVGDDSDNSLHVVRADSTNNTAKLDGFWVRKGKANGGADVQDTYGAGVLMNSSSSGLRNLVIEQNAATGMGGGLYKTGVGQPLMEYVIFNANSAGLNGGGLHTNNGNLTLRQVYFLANTAGQDGGGMATYSGDVSAYNLRFLGNSASANGGGLLFATQGKLFDVEASGNSAGVRGGGLVLKSNSITLTNATVVANSAGSSAGGIRQESATLVLQNSFIWNNKDASGIGTSGASIGNSGTVPTIRHSMIQGCKPGGVWKGSVCGTDLVANLPDIDPQLLAPISPLAAPTVNGDHRLRPTSPLRNKGDNAVLPLDLTTDAAGLPRIAGGVVDLGAHEQQ
jgi:hypothetical protein